VEIQRRLQELLRRGRGVLQLRVTVHPTVLKRLKQEDADLINGLEREFGGDLSFREDPSLHIQEFHINDVATGAEK
jgi:ribonuclease G